MGLSILNNIPSLEAQNQLSITNSTLQKTLFELSSGSKINSGADDPAGLSIANGLQANITALTQSAQNVTDGVGLLQTADGGLSQVTTLLNRAVTLATEAGNAGLTQGVNSQQAALQNEYTSISNEINQIGTNTTYNGAAVFTGSNMSVFLSDGSQTDANSPTIAVAMPSLSAAALGLATYATGTLDLTGMPQAGNTVTIGSQTYTFEAAGNATAANEVALGTGSTTAAQVQNTLLNLQAAVNGLAGAGTAYGSGTSPNGLAQIISVNGGAATVQALAAGTAGNSIPLSAVLTAGAGGVTSPLSGGTAPYGTLQLGSQPSIGTNAYGTLTLSGLPTNGDTVTIDTHVYTFVTSGNATNAGDVAIDAGHSVAQTLTNLANAINLNSGGSSTTYDPNQDTNVTASASGPAITVTSATPYAAGNGLIGFSASISNGFGSVVNGGGGADLGGGTNPDSVTLGSDTYTFVASGNATAQGQVAVGGSINSTLTHLKNAVNTGTGGSATTYGSWAGPNGAATISVAGNVATVTEVIPASAASTPVVSFSATGTIANDVGGTNNGTLANGVAANAVVSLNTTPAVGNTLTLAGETYTFVAAPNPILGLNGATAANEVALGTGTSAAQILTNTMVNLEEAVDGTGTPGTATYGVNTGPNTSVMIPTSGGGAPTVSNGVGTFTVQSIVQGTAGNSLSIISNLTSGVGGVVGSGVLAGGAASASLQNATNAQAALVTIENAISTVAGYRGTIGAGINQMNAALDVINNTSQNLTSSMSGIEDANIGSVISNMSKYQVLVQTGIAALAQSNTSEQAILRLLP